VDVRVVKVLTSRPRRPGVEQEPARQTRPPDPRDQVKLVLCDRADYDWARRGSRSRLARALRVLFSPSYGQLEAHVLAE